MGLDKSLSQNSNLRATALHSSSNTRVPSFHSFRTHSCHTYSLTTSGPALPVILIIQPQKTCLYPLFEPRSTSLKKQTPITPYMVVAGGEDYIQVEASVPLMGFEFLEGPEDFSALAAQLVQPTVRLMVPHFFVDNQGGTSEIRLLSRDNSAVTVNVKAFEDTSILLAEAQFELAPGRSSWVTWANC